MLVNIRENDFREKCASLIEKNYDFLLVQVKSLAFPLKISFWFRCRWFCHFDDDNYVNVPRLVRFLGDYNPREDWYLGKPSIQTPLEIINKDKTSVSIRKHIVHSFHDCLLLLLLRKV